MPDGSLVLSGRRPVGFAEAFVPSFEHFVRRVGVDGELIWEADLDGPSLPPIAGIVLAVRGDTVFAFLSASVSSTEPSVIQAFAVADGAPLGAPLRLRPDAVCPLTRIGDFAPVDGGFVFAVPNGVLLGSRCGDGSAAYVTLDRAGLPRSVRRVGATERLLTWGATGRAVGVTNGPLALDVQAQTPELPFASEYSQAGGPLAVVSGDTLVYLAAAGPGALPPLITTVVARDTGFAVAQNPIDPAFLDLALASLTAYGRDSLLAVFVPRGGPGEPTAVLFARDDPGRGRVVDLLASLTTTRYPYLFGYILPIPPEAPPRLPYVGQVARIGDRIDALALDGLSRDTLERVESYRDPTAYPLAGIRAVDFAAESDDLLGLAPTDGQTLGLARFSRAGQQLGSTTLPVALGPGQRVLPLSLALLEASPRGPARYAVSYSIVVDGADHRYFVRFLDRDFETVRTHPIETSRLVMPQLVGYQHS